MVEILFRVYLHNGYGGIRDFWRHSTQKYHVYPLAVLSSNELSAQLKDRRQGSSQTQLSETRWGCRDLPRHRTKTIINYDLGLI